MFHVIVCILAVVEFAVALDDPSCSDHFPNVTSSRDSLCQGLDSYLTCIKSDKVDELPATFAQIKAYCDDPFFDLPPRTSQPKSECFESCEKKGQMSESNSVFICNQWMHIQCLSKCPDGDPMIQAIRQMMPNVFVILQGYCQSWDPSWPVPKEFSDSDLNKSNEDSEAQSNPSISPPSDTGVKLSESQEQDALACTLFCANLMVGDLDNDNFTDQCIRYEKSMSCTLGCPGGSSILEAMNGDPTGGSFGRLCSKLSTPVKNETQLCIESCTVEGRDLTVQAICQRWNDFSDCVLERCDEGDNVMNQAGNEVDFEPFYKVCQNAASLVPITEKPILVGSEPVKPDVSTTSEGVTSSVLVSVMPQVAAGSGTLKGVMGWLVLGYLVHLVPVDI